MTDYAIPVTATGILLTLFFFWRLQRWLGWHGWFAAALPPTLALACWPPLLALLAQYTAVADFITLAGNLWLALVCFNFALFMCLGLLRAIVWLYYRILEGKGYDFLPPASGVPLTFVLLLCLMGYSAFEAHNIRVVNLGIQTDKLPKGVNSVRVVFISDLHLDRFTGESAVRRVVDLIKAQNADLLLFGGDIVGAGMSARQREAYMLSTAMPAYGSLGVLGNHEALFEHRKNAIPFLEKSWIHVMRGEALAVGGISMVGVDDPKVAEVQGSTVHDPMLILERMPANRFTLLMKHRPDVQPESIGLFDLQLAGHTHGGQIWPLKYVLEYIHGQPIGKLTRIENENGGGWYYASNGIGYWRLPLRLFTPPEIVVIDLVR